MKEITLSSQILLIASLILFSISILALKKSNLKRKSLFFSLFTFIYLFLSLTFLVSDYFTGKGINEAVIFHLEYGLSYAGFSEYAGIIIAAIIGIIILLIFTFWIYSSEKDGKEDNYLKYSSYILLIGAFLFNPGTYELYQLSPLDIGSLYAGSVSEINKTEFEKKGFFKYYRNPSIKQNRRVTKNLVFIYAESLERTYFNRRLFPGLIKHLRKFEAKSISFTDIRQIPHTGWTIAGMVSSQCGIPLVSPSSANSMTGMDLFLPGAVCLGDLLHREGYWLSYYGGGSLRFAGKGKFFKTHKFNDVAGLHELSKDLKDKNYKTGWGLYDDSTLEMAFNKFLNLSEKGKRFGLFLLTLDTHHPSGHRSRSCRGKVYKDGTNPVLNAVVCSDYLISEFISKIIDSPYGDKTVIVLTSDHLAMRNSATDILNRGKRRNLFMIIDPDNNKPSKISQTGSTLDIGTTLLPYLGYDGSIGLGRNLIKEKSLAEKRSFLKKKFKKWKGGISNFWKFPIIRDKITIHKKENRISLDKREFNLPILIEYNKKFETELRFQFYNPKKLKEYVAEFSKDRPFVYVDSCKKMGRINGRYKKNDICIKYRKLNHHKISSAVIRDDITISIKNL